MGETAISWTATTAPEGKLPDWIICGGGSGAHHRAMEMAWAADLRRQCAARGVAFFFKQDSGRFAGRQGRASPDLWATKQFPR